jgi:hypothetical protein
MNATNSKAITDIVSAKTPTHMPQPCVQLIIRGCLFAAVLGAVTLPAINGQSAENTTSKATCIDLSKHFTAQLTNSLNSPSSVTENNLATLPKGRHVFSGVPFEVGGLLQLAGKKLQEWGRNEYPDGKNSELAWTGTNPALKQYGGDHPGSLRIYKTTFENPQPGATITAIDYVSTMQNSSPFLIGLTIE